MLKRGGSAFHNSLMRRNGREEFELMVSKKT